MKSKKQKQFESLMRRLFQVVIVLLTLAVTGRAYVGWLSTAGVFSESQIEIEGADYFNDDEILRQSGLSQSIHLRRVNLDEVQQKLEANPFLEQVEIHKVYPRRLCLRIREKQPVALLNVDGALLCIDKQGLVLPSRPGRLYQLPVISGRFEGRLEAGVLAGGRMVKHGLNFIRTVLSEQPGLYDKISEVVVGHEKGTLVYTVDGAVPVWFGDSASAEKIRYFEAIYAELESKRQFSQVKYIDLRYKQQVVLGMRS